MKATVLHIHPSRFVYDSRIFKETKSLVDSSIVDEVFIGGVQKDGTKEHDNLDEKRKVWRVSLWTKALPPTVFFKTLKNIEWTLRIFFGFKDKNIKVVHCHGLSSLPAAVLFKIFSMGKIIYDAHELETERMVGYMRNQIAKIVERALIGYVDAIIVPSDPIAEWYKDKYGSKNISVIRNLPYPPNNNDKHSNVFREKFNISENETIYMYHGSLGKTRPVKFLLDVFSNINAEKHIVFMGYGDEENTVKDYGKRFKNIHFHPAVKSGQVTSYTRFADIGICIGPRTALSNRYALPNRLFECLAGGTPVIVDDHSERANVVGKNDCGWKIPVEETLVKNLIMNISRDDIRQKEENILKCKNDFYWQNGEEKLLKIYAGLLREVKR